MTGLSSRILVAFTETVVMTESDDLSITVLKGMTEVTEYSFDEGAEEPNRLHLKVK